MSGGILLLALLGAAGAFLLVDGVFGLIPRSKRAKAGLEGAARARMQSVERERITVLEEVPLLDRLLRPVLEDVVGLVGEQKREDVAARLRRSGWKYETVGDFYATRVLLAGMFFLAGGAFLAITGAGCLFWAPLALGVLGYFMPEQEVRSAIKERRRQVLTEMAFSLDQLALVLKVGVALQEAVGVLAETPGGPFIAALRRLARRVGAGGTRSIDEALDEFEADLPQDPELDQFRSRLRIGMLGTPIAESLDIQAQRLRAALNSRLLKRGLQTTLIISTVGAAFMLPALAILVLGPPLMLAFSVF